MKITFREPYGFSDAARLVLINTMVVVMIEHDEMSTRIKFHC